MRMRIQVVVESESDAVPVVHEVATLERDGVQPEGLGLTLAEAKDLLRGVQETMVAEQVAAFEAQQECCPNCGRTRRRNGRHEIVYRTPFGKLRLDSPRLYACPCQQAASRASTSPLAERLPERTAPELAYLESTSKRRLPGRHARLASGCWPSSAGRGLLPRRVPSRGFRVTIASSTPKLSWRTKR
jgi:hypothetical protein